MKKLVLAATAATMMANIASAATFPGINHDCKSAGSIEEILECQAMASWSDGRNSAIEEKKPIIEGLEAELKASAAALATEKAERLEDFHHLNDRGNKFKAERDLARNQLNSVVNVAKSQKHEINAMKAYIRTVFNRYGWMIGFPTPPNL